MGVEVPSPSLWSFLWGQTSPGRAAHVDGPHVINECHQKLGHSHTRDLHCWVPQGYKRWAALYPLSPPDRRVALLLLIKDDHPLSSHT